MRRGANDGRNLKSSSNRASSSSSSGSSSKHDGWFVTQTKDSRNPIYRAERGNIVSARLVCGTPARRKLFLLAALVYTMLRPTTHEITRRTQGRALRWHSRRPGLCWSTDKMPRVCVRCCFCAWPWQRFPVRSSASARSDWALEPHNPSDSLGPLDF